ncbi:hypothetical protein SMCF_3417, partial [Streptomyces coelicoflavus ZG0656]
AACAVSEPKTSAERGWLAEDGRLSAIDLGDDPGLRTDARVVFSRLGQDAVVFSPLFQAVGLVANGVDVFGAGRLGRRGVGGLHAKATREPPLRSVRGRSLNPPEPKPHSPDEGVQPKAFIMTSNRWVL